MIKAYGHANDVLRILLIVILLAVNSQSSSAFTTTRCPDGSVIQRTTRTTTTTTRSSRSTSLHAFKSKSVFGLALTREDGKNDKLLKQLLMSNLADHIQTVCLPCIGHETGPDFSKLPKALRKEWDWIAVTSPEAARILSMAWDPAHALPVCAVGQATCDALKQFGIKVAFVPTKATAEALVLELPLLPQEQQQPPTILYPASAQAATTLQDGLQARGCRVTRLNTYDTTTRIWTYAEQGLATNVQIACFASPTAVQGWLDNITNDRNHKPKPVMAACIGETSAAACLEAGWPAEAIFYPSKPGLEGWQDAVQAAVEALETKMAASKILPLSKEDMSD